ncbi:MAG: beta-galactosidase, partial [Clostridiales bacterium]|nr:beta-galactosidase [Clostridiales bacterium]
MERLTKIGKITPKKSSEISCSKISIGFEKLDRNAFDPEQAYDKVEELGVKLARLQSGWARTEKEKGVYDFEWIDKVADNLIKRGIEPWICLCYGNALYNEEAKKVFGAVGCPPIFTEEQKKGWENYVKAFVKHFEGRVRYYEVWNEPDGLWCWKHGVNATELGNFTRDTARFIKEIDSSAKVIGGVICNRDLGYLNEALRTGMGEYLDFISFHEYVRDEVRVFETVGALRALAKQYNPKLELIQGESGSQSRMGGNGALKTACWTEESQAKQLARHTIADLMTGVHFTSYFSCMDMIEGLNGTVGDKSSYMDFGYFGVIGAEFDDDGRASGNYYRKLSYYTLQNICSIFAEDFEPCTIPVVFHSDYSPLIMDNKVKRTQVISGGFSREGGKAFVYWYPSNILTTSV